MSWLWCEVLLGKWRGRGWGGVERMKESLEDKIV